MQSLLPSFCRFRTVIQRNGTYHNSKNTPVRRIKERLSNRKLFLIKSVVISFQKIMKDTTFRSIGLNHRFSPFLKSSGASRNLLQHLKHFFASSIIRHIHSLIRLQNAYQCHMGKVESFAYHLRSNQNIRFSSFKGFQILLLLSSFLGRISVHANHFRIRKFFLNQLLNFLCPEGNIFQYSATVRTSSVEWHLIIAIVTFQCIVLLMISQCDITVGTFVNVTAVCTSQTLGKTSLVQKQQHLFSFFKCLSNPKRKISAEHRIVSVSQFFSHIHNGYLRKNRSVHTILQVQTNHTSVLAIV